jgi:membrane peptidoglycan carboxypeptidase
MTDDWRAKLRWPFHLPALPWRRIAAGFAVAVAVIVVVPPVRRAIAFGTSPILLWLASPITPFVPDFANLPATTRLLAADGSELALLSGDNGRRQVVELDAIPEHVRRAVLAAEDADFYEHSGTNPLALVRAVGSTALEQLRR